MTEDPIELPWQARTARPAPLAPPDAFARIRDERPLRPMTFADGHAGWLATGYDAVRAILADDRFSIRRDIAHPAVAIPGDRSWESAAAPPPPGLFVRMDPPEHTRYRRLLSGQFTARRMKRLEARIEEITRDLLDAMERTGPPADLVTALAFPVPAMVISELLGVPDSDLAPFKQAIDDIFTPGADLERIQAAYARATGIFTSLIEAKRAEPSNDLYSDLINGSGLTDEELMTIGSLLLSAGFVTTAHALATGVFALLRNPDQAAALRADASLADNTVEEVLRFVTGPGGMLRTALEDVAVEGELIRAGQTVELLVGAANHDPARFERPGDFDITRAAHGHLTFGHGIHLCLGAQLARVEMRVVLPALVGRFPDLRLAVPAHEVPMDRDTPFYAPTRLPITWGSAR